ncbi:hypothetical protein ACFHYQ_28750 [Sphaerimonospora cavernae]|uniref:Uncharacterized protein n=1 Tax=Sphaerimonospora cavernae TaxID=1740611 RepID=A0ABV6UDL0_9ACTN
MPYRDVERRRMLAAAALGRDLRPPAPKLDGLDRRDGPDKRDGNAGNESTGEGAAGSPGAGSEVRLLAVSGRVLDISPHLIILEDDAGEERRLVVAPRATAWRGASVPPADLPVGARVVIRALRSGTVAERIWADITRITGIIRDVRGSRDLTIELDGGAHRRTRSIVVPYRFSGRIRVRHPQLAPGYLFDAIGVLDDGTALAHLPATSQPPYHARAVPPPSATYGGAQSKISGAAVWADLDEYGVAYPMLEADDVGCDDVGLSCAGLPYLALGSMLEVRNVCDGRAGVLPIVGCGCVAGRFCDRCLECGTSPRGRLVELSPAAYVELGGDLTKGCFNARIGLG